MSLKEYAKKRFLIVDELESFRFSTKKTLLELDLKLVDTASSAQSVIAGFQSVNYDVTLCNYDLGKGKNGQELLEELRYKKLLTYSDLFFIISAEVDRNKVMGTIENEPDGYLVKPVTPREIEQRLRKALKMKESMKEIDMAIDEGDFHSAIAYCDRKIADQDPYSLRCLKIKAWLLSLLGDVDAARDIYERVLSKGEHPWADYGLAKIMIRRKLFDEAEAVLKKIISRNGNQVEALDLLAKVYERQERTGEALETIQKAISLSSNSMQRQQHLANLCIQNGNHEQAIESYRALVKLSDQSVYAKPEQLFDFANYLAQRSQSEEPNGTYLKEANDLLERCQKRFSGTPEIEEKVKLVSANVFAISGDTDTARQLLQAVLAKQALTDAAEDAQSLRPETLKLAAQVFSSLGEEAEAERLLELAADLLNKDSELMSDIYDQLNQRIGTETRKRAALINKQGIKLYYEKKTLDAANELRKALPLTPRHISLNLNLAQVLIKLYRRTRDPELIKEINQRFHRVRHIPRHHKEYKRYHYLLDRLENELTKVPESVPLSDDIFPEGV
jgi:tetratricopeptide (TPR) repeat protein